MEKLLILILGFLVFNSIEINAQIKKINASLAEINSESKDEQKLIELFEAGMYVGNKKDTIPYRLLKPENYNPEKKYPLVVCLAGASYKGTDNLKQIGKSSSARVLAEKENRKKYPCFVFVPQCPPGHNFGVSNAPKDINLKPGKYLDPGIDSLVFDIIRILVKEHSIDTNRLYLTGVSMGGTGVWHFIFTHPQMFAAAVPVCGGSNPDLATKIINVPVWAFETSMDEINVKLARRMIEAIKNEGGNPIYTEVSDLNHIQTCQQAFYTPGLLDWLFAQKLK